MLEILRHAAFTFFRTKEADNFMEEHKIKIPDTLSQTLKGWKIDSIGNKTPELSLESSLFQYIRKAKKSIEKKCQYADVTKSLLSMVESEILEISQVVLVHSSDDGKDIPVINRFCINYDTVDTTDLSETIRIPTKEEIKEKDPDNPLLGCYILKTGTILLWIDRIFRERTTISGHLLFQKVLLHELIHALFDCADRDRNQVYLNEPKIIKDYEETLDNLLVLKCYETCDRRFLDSVYSFICSQSGPYRLAAPLFDLSRELGWTNKDYSSRISTLLYFKIQPYQSPITNHLTQKQSSSYANQPPAQFATHSTQPYQMHRENNLINYILPWNDDEEEVYDDASGYRNVDIMGLLVQIKWHLELLFWFPYKGGTKIFPQEGCPGMYIRDYSFDRSVSTKKDLTLKNIIFSFLIVDTKNKKEILVSKAGISFHFYGQKTKKTEIVYYSILENDVYPDKIYDPSKMLLSVDTDMHSMMSEIIFSLTLDNDSEVANQLQFMTEDMNSEFGSGFWNNFYSD